MTFRRTVRHWPLLFLLCLYFVALPAASASPDGPAGDVPALDVGAVRVDDEGFPTVVVTDRSRTLTIDQIAAGEGNSEITRGRVVAGLREANYWFGFRLHNNASEAVTRIISIDDWFHTDVIFYEHTPKGWRETKSGMVRAGSVHRPRVRAVDGGQR
ncbi:MAG: hypothetical protein KDB71_06155 [Mycobacterium sp.]|nr:hypothetical protein [Mycobacterium sp.]